MKQPFKLHRGPGECIGASRALCIDKLDHAALISFCYSAVRPKRRAGIRPTLLPRCWLTALTSLSILADHLLPQQSAYLFPIT